jgi:hypothetical protein
MAGLLFGCFFVIGWINGLPYYSLLGPAGLAIMPANFVALLPAKQVIGGIYFLRE